MKKIRILAAVLAVLMLPLATLFACGDKTPPEPPKQDLTQLIINPEDPPKEPDVKIDNDGSKDGYLLFYNFNEHEAGNLKETEPYSDFITPVEKEGCSYIVVPKKGAENDNALLIQRPAGNTQDPYLSIAVKNASELSPQHMIEFDLRWEKGLFLGTASVQGRKEGPTTTAFLQIKDDAICDGGGTVVYGDKATDAEGWLHVQIVVNDLDRTYDLYIDGVKKLDKSPFVNTSYKAWDAEQAAEYRIWVDTDKDANETLLYVDNVAVKNCVAADVEYDATDITYKDSYEEMVPFINLTKEGFVEFVTAANRVAMYDGGAKPSTSLDFVAVAEDGTITSLLPVDDYKQAVADETPVVVPEGAKPGIKYSNFVASGGELVWKYPDMENFNPELYNTFRFSFYATEKMFKDGYRFMIYFYCGQNEGGMSYYSFDFYPTGGNKYVQGWNTFELVVTNGSKSRSPDYAKFEQVRVTFSGWSNGINKVAEDGYDIIIGEFGFVSSRSVVVNGPSKGNEGCAHVDADGKTYFADVADPIAATCTAGSYYVEKCSVCGATQIDEDKEKTRPLGHTYDTDVVTVNPTCGAAGYTYQDCSVCGYRKTISTISNLAHAYTTEYDWNIMKKYEICRNCGQKNEASIVLEMIGIEEKLALLGTEANPTYYYCDEDTNETVKFDGTNSASTGSGQQVNYMVNVKYCLWQAMEHDITGDMVFIHKKTNETQASDSYFDLRFTDRYAKGTNVVAEFKVMLGSKGADGKYAAMNISWMDRNSGGGNLPTFFNITTDGKLKSYSGKLYDLYDNKFVHVAFAYKPATGLADIYLDGKLVEEKVNVGAKPTFLANDMRFTWATKNATEHGASHYFNDFLGYAASAPICVLPDGESIIENVGPIAVNGVNASFSVSNAPVKGTFSVGTFTSKYVMGMNLTASGSLKDGALLNGVKVVEGFEEKLALLEVKGGKLYSMGVLVANSVAGKIEVVCNDQHDTISVYVDSVCVLDNYNYTAGVYADSDEYVSGIVFEALGNYSVSDFELYTGTAPKGGEAK